jgi:hypothetical protein
MLSDARKKLAGWRRDRRRCESKRMAARETLASAAKVIEVLPKRKLG